MKKPYFYGYNIVAAGALTQAVIVGAMFTYGVFFKEFQNEFGWSRALISGASSLSFLMMGAFGIIAGTLNDRIGPRKILTVSAISLGIGYLLLSRLQSPWQLYLFYGGLVGIGFSTHDVNTLSTVARWFVRRRGMMSGLVKMGTGAGQFSVPLVAAFLVAAYGWRHSYLIIGGGSLIALVAVAQWMKRDPSEMGLNPDGDAPSGPNHHGPAAVESTGLSFQKATRTLQFWLLCLAEFFVFFCLLTTIVHIVPHGMDLGLAQATAAAVLSTMGGVSILGRFVMGMVMDRIAGKRSLMLGLLILITSLIWLQFSTSAWMLFLFAAIYGFSHGALFTVMSPTVAELFGTRSHGLLFGMVLFSGDLGGSLGPWLTGYIFDVTGSYRTAFTLLLVLALSGFGMIACLRPVREE
jgi:MFS family permease